MAAITPLTPPIRPADSNHNGVVSAPTSENGHASDATTAGAETDTVPSLPERPSVKSRLTRMFSAKDTRQTALLDSASSPKKLPAQSTTPATAPNTSTIPVSRPHPPSRKASMTEKALEGINGNSAKYVSHRFVLNSEAQGGHEHHLKSNRRQEKLSHMFKSLLGKKAENVNGNSNNGQGDHDLSLVSSWVATMKNEEEPLAVLDRKGGPKETATLVEKYGKCQEIVGRGAFGIVRISHKKIDSGGGEKLYAVKEFRRRAEETEKRYSKRLTSEFCISSSLRHPNVIHTLDLLKDAKGDYCEVMEYCAGGDLYTLILSAGKLEPQEADCFFKQMMRGVEYMHEMGVAHRDLKPENLLLTTNGALKITDFGNGECFRMAWENDAHMVSGLCGSAPYIAPEEYIDREFDARAVDVWACGVIYMAMRTGRHLWKVAKKDTDDFYAMYLKGRKDEKGYSLIESLQKAQCGNVIYSILDPNPSRRITASQVLKSEWGREIQLCKAGEEGL